jgi:NAD(P)-dependent dehydrogenase (short-subunit alcohol dehydrogenase family)
MRRQGSGAIVNTVSGIQCGAAALSIYGATKGAVASFTYCVAMELADTAIRINAISPRGDTRMADVFSAYAASVGVSNMASGPAPPEHNAPVHAYLLSDASRHVNGQVVRLEGAELMLVTHPALLRPAAQLPEWSAEAVAAAFEATLPLAKTPLGMGWVSIAD